MMKILNLLVEMLNCGGDIEPLGGDASKVRLRKWARRCVRVLSEPARDQQFDNSSLCCC